MAAVTVPLPKKKMSKQSRHETMLFYICIAPFIIGVLFFDFIPLAASFILSFTQWDVLCSQVHRPAELHHCVYQGSQLPDHFEGDLYLCLRGSSTKPGICPYAGHPAQ